MIMSHCFLILPILEASAEIKKYFSSIFGSSDNLKKFSEINQPLEFNSFLDRILTDGILAIIDSEFKIGRNMLLLNY